jgi:hypothetical protein
LFGISEKGGRGCNRQRERRPDPVLGVERAINRSCKQAIRRKKIMRLTVLTLIALAGTLAASTLGMPDIMVRLGMLAVISLACVRVLVMLAGDGLYGKSANAKSGSGSSVELGSAQR